MDRAIPHAREDLPAGASAGGVDPVNADVRVGRRVSSLSLAKATADGTGIGRSLSLNRNAPGITGGRVPELDVLATGGAARELIDPAGAEAVAAELCAEKPLKADASCANPAAPEAPDVEKLLGGRRITARPRGFGRGAK